MISEARQTIEKLDEVIKKGDLSGESHWKHTWGVQTKRLPRLSSAVRIITVMLILGSVS